MQALLFIKMSNWDVCPTHWLIDCLVLYIFSGVFQLYNSTVTQQHATVLIG